MQENWANGDKACDPVASVGGTGGQRAYDLKMEDASTNIWRSNLRPVWKPQFLIMFNHNDILHHIYIYIYMYMHTMSLGTQVCVFAVCRSSTWAQSFDNLMMKYCLYVKVYFDYKLIFIHIWMLWSSLSHTSIAAHKLNLIRFKKMEKYGDIFRPEKGFAVALQSVVNLYTLK